MYEQHFGLSKRPFTAKPKGNDVFVGPQTASTMSRLKKALVSQDAVIVVSGPAGSGKTTLVARALDALSGSHRVVRIGRMQLQGTDALEFLLEELGVTQPPRGPIRQFAALRSQLSQLETQNSRVVVVIEDAMRTGAEALSELEALTAADAGDSGGAAIVLMGDDRLAAFCKDPQLARLDQRVRQRLTITALSAAELRAYLMHSFRLAGADFEFLFDSRCAALIHALSSGIPRLANNIVDAALSGAALAGIQKIPASFVADVAKDEFGLEAEEFDTAPAVVEAAPEPDPEPEPVPESEPESVPEPVLEAEPDPLPLPKTDHVPVLEAEPDPVPVPEPDHVPVLEAEPDPVPVPEPDHVPVLEAEPDPVPVPEPDHVPVLEAEPDPVPVPEPDHAPVLEAEPEAVPDPVIVFSDEPPVDTATADFGIPELIQDTLPDLEILAPEIMAAEQDEAQPEPEPEPQPEPDPEPVLVDEPAPVVESAAEDIPEWERDPTLAELRPDLDALEKAMAFAHGDTDDTSESKPEANAVPPSALPKVETVIDEIPEITLDNAIQARIEDHLIDEPGEISPARPDDSPAAAPESGIPEIRLAPQRVKKADAELEKIAAELAKAKTIEDVNDEMAETLFGEELNLVAAQVVAAGTPPDSANDGDLELFDTTAGTMAQSAAPVPVFEPVADAPVVDAPVVDEQPAVEISLHTREHGGEAGLDLSASQRLKTVRALNAELHPSLREPETAPTPTAAPVPPTATPEPIEDQINTSMTQTLKALNVRPPISEREVRSAFDDEDEEEKKGGFFSRFRRS